MKLFLTKMKVLPPTWSKNLTSGEENDKTLSLRKQKFTRNNGGTWFLPKGGDDMNFQMQAFPFAEITQNTQPYELFIISQLSCIFIVTLDTNMLLYRTESVFF